MRQPATFVWAIGSRFPAPARAYNTGRVLSNFARSSADQHSLVPSAECLVLVLLLTTHRNILRPVCADPRTSEMSFQGAPVCPTLHCIVLHGMCTTRSRDMSDRQCMHQALPNARHTGGTFCSVPCLCPTNLSPHVLRGESTSTYQKCMMLTFGWAQQGQKEQPWLMPSSPAQDFQ